MDKKRDKIPVWAIILLVLQSFLLIGAIFVYYQPEFMIKL
jgi:hypothetical protein